jgi:hypothetical protein
VKRAQRRADLGAHPREPVHVGARHVFKRLHRAAGGHLQAVQQPKRFAQRGQRDHRRGIGRRARHELQHGGGDHPKRALRADQKVAQIVARVVLVQLGHQVHHPAVGQHRLEPEHQRAGIAVAQHVGAARVGRHHAANRRRPLGAEGERKGEALRPGGVVEPFQHHPRPDNGNPRRCPDFADLVQPFEREERRAVRVGVPPVALVLKAEYSGSRQLYGSRF